MCATARSRDRATEGGQWLRKEPKTASSVRSITLSPFVAEQLAGHLERFAAAGVDGLVFPNAKGNPLISSNFWNNHFAKAQRHVGVTCRFHDLRHTSVALAIAGGAHPKAIQTRMGHSSITVTLDRYGHLFPELDEGSRPASALSSARTRAAGQHGRPPLVRRPVCGAAGIAAAPWRPPAASKTGGGHAIDCAVAGRRAR
jgi:hypothetical protein